MKIVSVNIVAVSFAVFLAFDNVTAYSQENPDYLIERIVDEFSDYEEVGFDDYDLDLLSNKIKINNITDNEILGLPFLNLFQKNALIAYRKEWGDIHSPMEIAMIDGFDRDLAYKIAPHLDFSFKTKKYKYTPKQILTNANYDFLLRVSANNNSNNGYYGDLHKVLAKLKYNLDEHLKMGLTLEKDAGERFFYVDKGRFRLEHISGFMSWTGDKLNVLLGDYYVQFGQGLSMWNGTYFGGGVEASSQLRIPKRIKPNTSCDETNYLRGVAADLELKSLTLTAYASYRKKDATIYVNEDTGVKYFRSLSKTGYHRNENEMSKIGQVKEFVAGANVGYSFNTLMLSANINCLRYDIPCVSESTFLSGSLNFVKIFKYSYLYGEASLSGDMGFAAMAGWYIQPNSYLNMELLSRYSTNGYHNVSNSDVGDNTFSIRATMYPVKKLTMIVSVNSSDNSNSIFNVRSKFQMTRFASIYLDYRFSTKSSENTADDAKLPMNTVESKHKVRLNIEYLPYNFLTLRTRLEGVVSGRDVGCLLYNDIAFRFYSGISLLMRMTCFDTDGYDTRIYCYENDVLYSYTSPAYYGSGYAFYILLKIPLFRNVDFWCKIGDTENIDRNTNKLSATIQLRTKI